MAPPYSLRPPLVDGSTKEFEDFCDERYRSNSEHNRSQLHLDDPVKVGRTGSPSLVTEVGRPRLYFGNPETTKRVIDTQR